MAELLKISPFAKNKKRIKGVISVTYVHLQSDFTRFIS